MSPTLVFSSSSVSNGFPLPSTKSHRLGGIWPSVYNSVAHRSLSKAQPFSSGWNVEGFSSQECLHTQLTEIVCFISLNGTFGSDTLDWQTWFLLKGLRFFSMHAFKDIIMDFACTWHFGHRAILHKQRISMHTKSCTGLLVTCDFLYCAHMLLFSVTKKRLWKFSQWKQDISGGHQPMLDLIVLELNYSLYVDIASHIVGRISKCRHKLRVQSWPRGCGRMPILKYPSPLKSEQNGWTLPIGLYAADWSTFVQMPQSLCDRRQTFR